MAKKVIRINEEQLKKIVAESVKKVIKENDLEEVGGHVDNFSNSALGFAMDLVADAICKIGEKFKYDAYTAEHYIKKVMTIWDPDDLTDGALGQYSKNNRRH